MSEISATARSSRSTPTRVAPAGPWRWPTWPGSWPATASGCWSVDWDLESPGLHKFFHPFLDESTVSATPGVIEIINDYATAAVDPGPRRDDWHLEFAQRRAARRLPGVGVSRRAASSTSSPPAGRTVTTLPRSARSTGTTSTSGWAVAASSGRCGTDMKQNYDYVLIDSRTGLSDVADICTIELPDVLTICFTLSDQSIEGAANVARQISDRYRDRNIRVLPVPMRIEDGEKEKLDVGRALARMKFEGFPAGDDPGGARLCTGPSVEVPYKPFYAFEETLATFGDDPGLARLAARLVRADHRRHHRRPGHRHAADRRGAAAAVQGRVRPPAARPSSPRST